VRNLSFGDIGVSTAVDESDAASPVAVMLVQEPGKPLRDAVIYDVVPGKR
jgi:hypothetical protein